MATTTIKHHLDDATLLSYAAGALPEALAAVAAAHISRCKTCAAELKHMQRLGADILSALEPEPLSRPAPTLALRLQDAAPRDLVISDPVDRPTAKRHGSAVTNPAVALLARIGSGNLDGIVWRRLGIGLWHAPVPLSQDKGDLRLIKVAPGRRLPEHGHGGGELTLILHGAYTDDIGTFGPGDVADLDDTIEHQPIADADIGCICLIAFEQKARFKGLIPRLLQPFTGM